MSRPRSESTGRPPAFSAPALPGEVAAIFDSVPERAWGTLTHVRRLIFETAAQTGAGPLTETLKWGEPAYLTEATKSGSTVRLGWKAKTPERCFVFFICTTRLVEDFRARFGEALAFEGNRAIVLPAGGPVPEAPLGSCLAMALTYHRKALNA